MRNKNEKRKTKKYRLKRNKILKMFLFEFLVVIFIFSFLFFHLSPTGANAEIPTISRDSIITYADTGVGSPYVWGGDKWDPNNRAWAGADCSGFVIKAWQLPNRADYTQSVGHPYNTYSFYYQTTHWKPINRDSLAKGDVLVYRSGSGGHMVIYHYGDPWGAPVVYEARSRKTGIIHGARYFPSSFVARRRNNLSDSDAKLMASKKSAKGQVVNALPDSYAGQTTYLDYFSQDDSLKVFNTDTVYSTNVLSYLFNNQLIESRSLAVNPLGITLQNAPWKASAYLKLASGGQKVIAYRQSADGYQYLSKSQQTPSLSNFVGYFEPKREVLYLTNPNSKTVKAKISLINNGKIYFKKIVKIAAKKLSVISLKRTSAKRVSGSYARIDSFGGRIFAGKKTASSYFVSASPSASLARTLFINNFNANTDLVILANPTTRPTRVSIKYMNNNTSYYTKSLVIGPRDVRAVYHSSSLRTAGEVYVRLSSSKQIIATKKTTKHVYNTGESGSVAATTLYIPSLVPTQDLMYITNPLGSSQNATVDVYSNGTLVYNGVYTIGANTQTEINLSNTAAAAYSDVQIKITASF